MSGVPGPMPDPPAPPVLSLTDAVVRFDSRPALDGVTLAPRPGAVTAVVGGDGAGKTTLMRALVGHVGLDEGQRVAPPLAQIGYAPASTGSWRGMTVAENLDFVAGTYHVPAATLARRGEELLAAAGLADVRDRLSGQLSGGMSRKLAVVLAMIHDPEVLILDEPSTGVDPVSRVDLWRLATQAAAAGTTVVMSTSYLDEAERASHVVVLAGGRTLVAGPPADLLADFPGVLTEAPVAHRREWAWRRGRVFRELWPDPGAVEPGPTRVTPDLEDVVIARSLLARNQVEVP